MLWTIVKVISKGDYNYCKVKEIHPDATKDNYILEHRVIMENHLGRLLEKDEIVHHKDHNKRNNSIENLEVMSKEEHYLLHSLERSRSMVELKCPSCKKIFEIERRQTYLVKHTKYNCTCCSASCRGTFYRKIQLFGITDEIQTSIDENFIKEFKKPFDANN